MENPDQFARLYETLGELSADMKHVLRALTNNRIETERLQIEMREENRKLTERLTKVEQFNLKIIAYASVLVPLLMFAVQWAVPALIALI